jgi:hypothetical protein
MSATTVPATGPVRTVGPGSRHALLVVGVVALMALAFAVRLRLLLHGAAIAASDGYDDGVYYAAADALVHGRLPYRDFLLLHPPGIVVVLAPFAALGAVLGDPVGVTLARLAFLGVGAMSTGLIAVLALRHSRTAAVVAGVGAAVFFPLAYSERSTLLEPVGTALLLWSLLVSWRRPGRRGALLAGLLAGCAIDVKIWYVVPVLVLGLLRERDRGRYLLGAGVAAAAVALPFLVAAPVAMVREVVLDQLGRPGSDGLHVVIHRLTVIGSDPRIVGASVEARRQGEVLAALVLVLVGITALAAWRVRWARVLVLLAGATVLVLLLSPSFFPHYVAFAAPWMLLVLGVGTAELGRRVRSRPAAAVAALLPLAVVVAVNAPMDLSSRTRPQPAAAVHAAMIGRSGCVLSDDPGLLADAGLLSRDLRQGCPLWPDVTGWTYDRDRMVRNGHVVARVADHRWQQDVMRYLLSGRYVILNRPATGLSAANRRLIHRLPVVVELPHRELHEVRG